MKIQSSLAKAAEVQRNFQTQNAAPQPCASRSGLTRRFDSVTIRSAGQSPFEMDLRGRISQEVRTATSSGMIAELQRQVQDGSYETDSTAVARKMLLLGEAV